MKSMKKLRFNRYTLSQIKPFIAVFGIALATLGSGAFHYSYSRMEDVSSESANDDNTYTDEEGILCHLFDVGEHKIFICNNDFLCRTIEPVEGYKIESVEVNGWVDHNEVVYVNEEPVVVKASGVKENGQIEFANFGETVKGKARVIK